MESASVLLIVAAIAVGVVSAVLRTWSLHARTYTLEDRVDRIEGNLSREVKARAAQERWKAPKHDEALLAALSTATPAKPKPWWESIPSTVPRAYDGK